MNTRKQFAHDLARSDGFVPAPYTPIWEYTNEDLNGFQVTPENLYFDAVWQKPVTTPGMAKNACAIHWKMELFDGSRLDEAQHAKRLDWARKLMSLILHAPSNRMPPAAGSMSTFQNAFKYLLSWMAETGYQRPEELTASVIAHYIDDLPRFILEQKDDEEISVDEVRFALKILSFLWSERHTLAKWGVPSLTSNPLHDKRGINGYATQIATKAKGWIKPLPDEVAIPLFNKAGWFLGEPAEDVIRLLEIVRDPIGDLEFIEVPTRQSSTGLRRQTPGQASNSRSTRANRFLSTFQFSTVKGENTPWHSALDTGGVMIFNDVDNNIKSSPLMRARLLLDAVRDACAIIIQGTTGVRISELLGIKAGMNKETGLPVGVRMEKSATGLYDVFLLRTIISKTKRGTPQEMDWLLGIRPVGTSEEPLSVKALRILNRLYEPWREKTKSDRLILSWGKGGKAAPPPKTTSLSAMGYTNIRDRLKLFITHWVDLSGLPNESAHKFEDNNLVKWRVSKGQNFSTHMLRKSWAQFIFAVDPKLRPAIQMQFHHLSLAMSDTGYIGNNPNLGNVLKTVETHQKNLLIFETVMGHSPLAGKMGERIEETTRDLAIEVKGLPTSEAWQRVVQFCDANTLQIWFTPYGQCIPLQSSKMACQGDAKTPQILRLWPNDATRNPTLCSGCDCWILDTRHATFWEKRYFENLLNYKRAEKIGGAGNFRVIKERADQARKLLAKIGVTVVCWDHQIEAILKEEHVAT